MTPPPNDLLAEHLGDDVENEINEFDPELMLAQTLADPDLLQYFVRTRRDGVESIACYVRCELSPGQQRAVLHIPFAPPFGSIPSIEALVSDDTTARVRVTDRQKFGARLEIVLLQPAETRTQRLVEVMASAESQEN